MLDDPVKSGGQALTEPPARLGRSRRWTVVPVVLLGVATLLTLVIAGGRRSSDEAVRSPLVWRSVAPPESGSRHVSLVATTDGFAMLGAPAEGSTLWSSTDGERWQGTPLDLNPMGITVRESELVLFREYRGVVVAAGADGWLVDREIELPTYVRSGYQSGRPGLVDVAGELFAHSVDGELYQLSPEGEATLVVGQGLWWAPAVDLWERFTAPLQRNGCNPPVEGSLDYLPLFASPDGFVALVPSQITGPKRTYPVCDPRTWVSSDGFEWRAVVGAGFGRGSYVYDVATSGGRILAVGGVAGAQPALWSSTDGRTWTRLTWPDTPAPAALSAVAGGPLGFIVIGGSAAGSNEGAWYSADGTCWLSLPEGMSPVTAAVGADFVLVADARPDGPIWVGAPSQQDPTGCDIVAEPLG